MASTWDGTCGRSRLGVVLPPREAQNGCVEPACSPGIVPRPLWYPFTQMRDLEADPPLRIVGGRGVKLRDDAGREYYDANSSLWVNLHGHGRPELDAAIREQLARVAHTSLIGLSHPGAEALAERLARLAPPGLTRVFFSDNGATAVEIALKMAYQYWRQRGETHRHRFVAFRQGYHGDTLGAVSVGGIPLFHSVFRDLVFEVEFAPSPASFHTVDGALTAVEAALTAAGAAVAVVVEPLMQAAGGMRPAPAGFLRGLREVCDRRGVLLIADEVAVGFGRTGRMFACEHEGVSPDLLCLAKGLTGGYLPLAATLATEEIHAAFLGEYEEFRAFLHGHSYTGNPLACAAALASLDLFESDAVLAGLPPKIEAARRGLTEIERLPQVREVRQVGLMAGIELARGGREPYPAAERVAYRACMAARGLGLITRNLLDTITFVPPLVSTETEIADMLRILAAAIRQVTEA
jgi:adenosylmethionine-8-amino-7-oxononanoate transaminase